MFEGATLKSRTESADQLPEMQPYSLFDASWPVVLAFGLVGTLTLGLTNTGHDVCGEMLSWAASVHGRVEPALPVRPQVLVITSNRDDQTRVALTVIPRGYRVVVAETAASGSEILRSQASRICVVVLDTKMRGAESIAAMAQSLVPVAKLIKLRPNHAAADVSKPLSDAI